MNFFGLVILALGTEAFLHPNVLLIIVDDLRPTLGCYGDDVAVTPYIDDLADTGIIFSRAYAQQALCGPSRTSFLTSRRPDTTQLIDVHSYWRHHSGNFTSLPQYFKEHGYHTFSAGKVFHPGIVSNHSDDQPYSWSETPYHPSSQAHKQDPVCLGRNGNLQTDIYCPVNIQDQPEKTLPDIQTTDFVLSWLTKWDVGSRNITTPQQRPFFLAVGYHKPHIPLKFPVEFLDLYPIEDMKLAPDSTRPDGLPLVAWNPWNDLRRRDDVKALNLSFPFGPMPNWYARYIRQGYFAATSYTDSLIGAVVSSVKMKFPNTIIALIGDHGWSLGEHQEWSKFSNYEVATRVPFIVSLPDSNYKNKNGVLNYNNDNFMNFYKTKQQTSPLKRKYDGIAELVDLFPTLVDLAGLPALKPCPERCSKKVTTCTEGISHSCIIHSLYFGTDTDALKYNCPFKKGAISQYPRPSLEPSVCPDSDQPKLKDTKFMGYSLRTRRFRYTAWLPFNKSSFKVDWNGLVAEELYDHDVDQGEDRNIFGNFIRSYEFRNHLKKVLDQPQKTLHRFGRWS